MVGLSLTPRTGLMLASLAIVSSTGLQMVQTRTPPAQRPVVQERTEIPEPGTVALLGIGTLALGLMRRRRR